MGALRQDAIADTFRENANVGASKFEEKLSAALEYLQTRNFPRNMIDRVKDYYYVRYVGGKFFDEAGILDDLNLELRKEIAMFSTRHLQPKTPVLFNSPPAFFSAIASCLRAQSFFDGDVVVSEGASRGDMFFVHGGFCEVLLRAANNTAIRYLASGCYFGEASTLLGVKRTATVRAAGHLELFALQPRDLLRACSDFPEVGIYMKEVALNRVQMLMQYDPGAELDAVQDAQYIDSEDALTPFYKQFIDTHGLTTKRARYASFTERTFSKIGGIFSVKRPQRPISTIRKPVQQTIANKKKVSMAKAKKGRAAAYVPKKGRETGAVGAAPAAKPSMVPGGGERKTARLVVSSSSTKIRPDDAEDEEKRDSVDANADPPSLATIPREPSTKLGVEDQIIEEGDEEDEDDSPMESPLTSVRVLPSVQPRSAG